MTGADESLEPLLHWCSARREGSRVAFREAHDWMTGDAKPRAAMAALHSLEVLGHLEIDWSSGTWAINPPMLAFLPDSGGNAVAVGSRSPSLRDRIMSFVTQGACFFTTVTQARGPEAWFVGVSDEAHLQSVASGCGLAVEYGVSRRYSRILPHVEDVVKASRRPFRPGGVEVCKFNAESLTFEPFPWRGGALPVGTYEHRGGGPNVYTVVHEDATTSVTERRVAVHYELGRLRRGRPGDPRWVPIGWVRETGDLLCDVRTPLPLLQTRAAVMATGMLPAACIAGDGVPVMGRRVLKYQGVNLLTYRAIAESLDVPSPVRSRDA